MRKKVNRLSYILKNVLLVLLISVAVAVASGNAIMIASATPSVPGVTSYWGNVTMNSTLQSNTMITVHGSNGVKVADTTSNQDGLYQISLPWDDSNTTADEGVISGETITFKVNGTTAQSTIVQVQGTNTRLNLIAISASEIVTRYSGADGIIQKTEAIRAVTDYFNGIITKENAIVVVTAFFNAAA